MHETSPSTLERDARRDAHHLDSCSFILRHDAIAVKTRDEWQIIPRDDFNRIVLAWTEFAMKGYFT